MHLDAPDEALPQPDGPHRRGEQELAVVRHAADVDGVVLCEAPDFLDLGTFRICPVIHFLAFAIRRYHRSNRFIYRLSNPLKGISLKHEKTNQR